MSRWIDLAGTVRYALRQWRRAPGFAAVSIGSLALGIGATATVFSALYSTLVEPYPYRGAGRMIQVRLLNPSGRSFLLLSARQFEEFRKLEALDGAVAMDSWDMASTGDALPEPVRAAHLSADAFEYFGVPPIAGRVFSSAGPRFDQAPERVAVLSDSFWRRRYGGSAHVIGESLELDHRNYLILGVMPPRFRLGNSDVYTPLALTSDPNRIYLVDARLKPGVSRERAEAAMQPLLERFAKETPAHFPREFRVRVQGLVEGASASFRVTLFLLFGAVSVLLALGCANVSILSLARGTVRQPDLAVRAALGASRLRLIAALLSESLMLSLAGGAAGVVLAIGGVRLVAAELPYGALPPEAIIHLNFLAVVFSAAAAVIAGILSGMAPALRFSLPQLTALVGAQSLRVTTDTRGRRTQQLLVGAQVALTIVVLAAAGRAGRSFLRLYQTRLGYDPGHVLTVRLALPDGNYTAYGPRAAFYRALQAGVAASSGVESVALAQFPIPPAEPARQAVEVAGNVSGNGRIVDLQQATGEYFSTLRIPLLQGRTWSAAESDRAARVVVINEEMARRFWPDGTAVGRKIRFPRLTAFTAWIVAATESNGWLEIIGIVGNTPNRGLREPAAPEAYVPYTLVMGDSISLVIRTKGTPLGLSRAVREQIHRVDAGQPVSRMQTAEDLLREEGWAREQFIAAVFLVQAILALVLAVAGLYSVVSYATARRAHEFGVRVALGAREAGVVGLVLSFALTPVGAGVAFGVALALLCSRLLARWIPPGGNDLVSLGGAASLLCIAAAVAAFLPARRAARSDPMRILRAE